MLLATFLHWKLAYYFISHSSSAGARLKAFPKATVCDETQPLVRYNQVAGWTLFLMSYYFPGSAMWG